MNLIERYIYNANQKDCLQCKTESELRKFEVLNFKIANKMIMAEFTKYEDNHKIWVRVLEKIPICIRHYYLKFARRLLMSHKNNSEFVLVTCKGNLVIKRSMLFGGEKFLEFEGADYPVPLDYHTYLTLNYGNYMEPLPEEKQKGHELDMGEIEWCV